ncbi:long-chain-fatty-acid--CoA ligase [Caldinitratiruptor microaerophilus]|uniref:Long-chain-fatty-acid--CoA ligase n=1 Tax=Caldinitratiruptor microaerophilus TaxID=671077 RepID=A0AA35CIJ9_9FIRM|nr:long-chain fatty acid--CoA ligase [Caldinitratiruptor microaerophilus]BDG58993.1 long-chain-fatty-acid--CoA ligase [Caldinitratiruptor microaerophilus]
MTRPWLKHYPEGVRAHLEYPRVPLYALLDETAAHHPDLTALRFYQHRLTYRELAERVNRFAAALAGLGVRKGDRVALMLPNSPAYVIGYYGTLKAGGIVAQVNPLYTGRELLHILNDSGAETIVVADVLYPKVQSVQSGSPLKNVLVARLQGGVEPGPGAHSMEALIAGAAPQAPEVAVDAGDVAVLQYTGGTTGVSKGAMLTHFNLVANALQVKEWMAGPAEPGQERILTVLPLFHVYGMTVCMNFGLATASELILLPRFEIAEVMNTIRETRPTFFPGVPTMYVAVNNFPDAESYGVSSIRRCNSGGAPLPFEVMQAFERRFGSVLFEGYGLSEASPVTHANPVVGLRKPGTIGIPYPDTDAEIVDIETGERVLPPGEVGELRIRGPQVMAGYWNRPDETAKALRNGWLYTGDIAKMDEDGYFTIVERKKDMIITSGYNVFPREVEEVLYEHPAVLEAAVAGIPDPYRGEAVKAYVVLRPGMQATEEEIIAFCRERIAPFKAPRAVEFRDSLPKSAVGKVLRRLLTEGERQA